MSTVTAAYGSGPIKRFRRTQANLSVLKSDLRATVNEIAPATVRQVYYQAVSRGLIDKTEQGYKLIGRLLTQMRRDGQLPFQWIADNTRWQRKPNSHEGLADLLEETARLYRRSVWSSQSANVEVWLEKDALAGVLVTINGTSYSAVTGYRGYPSLTFLHSAAEAIAAAEKPTYLYYLGDDDPSGIDIPVKVEAGIREFAPDAEVHFERVAVTEAQIKLYKLPTRPTKKSDTRSKGFGRESVEVDALPPSVLRDIVRRCIEQHIDHAALATLQTAEASERDYLARWAEQIAGEA